MASFWCALAAYEVIWHPAQMAFTSCAVHTSARCHALNAVVIHFARTVPKTQSQGKLPLSPPVLLWRLFLGPTPQFLLLKMLNTTVPWFLGFLPSPAAMKKMQLCLGVLSFSPPCSSPCYLLMLWMTSSLHKSNCKLMFCNNEFIIPQFPIHDVLSWLQLIYVKWLDHYKTLWVRN